ncbi:MAG: hypothetical protein ACXAEX_10835 [Promethearchaeota archaeon]
MELNLGPENSYTDGVATKALDNARKETIILESDKEKSNHSVWLDKKSFRIALISTFTALAVVLGYLLAYIPNIELFTLMIFLSGFILGIRDGMIIGALSSLVFVFFNPIGASPPPLLLYQLFHYTLTGLSGALTSRFLKTRNFYSPKEDLYSITIMIILGIIGVIITTSFQVLSTLVDVFVYFGSIREFLPYFLTGIPFTIVHIIGNMLGFTFILPGLIQLIYKLLN